MTLGKRLKMVRDEHDLTQEELAIKMGISQRTISSWECDRNIPDMDTYKQLSKIYDCSIAYLTGTKESRELSVQDVMTALNSFELDDLEEISAYIKHILKEKKELFEMKRESKELRKRLEEYERRIKELEGSDGISD